MPESVVHDMRLVVDELLANVILHGYAEDPTRRVVFEVEIGNGVVKMLICDQAEAFDPFARAPPDLDAEPDERPIGGLGIQLVRSVTDCGGRVQTQLGDWSRCSCESDGACRAGRKRTRQRRTKPRAGHPGSRVAVAR